MARIAALFRQFISRMRMRGGANGMILTLKDNSDPIGGFGGRTWYGTTEMDSSSESMHVRTVEFLTEEKLAACPSVSHQIACATDGAEPILAYALKINQDVGGQTQIVIEAVTLSGEETEGIYYCSVTIVEPV
jgi:hypothetical protein